MRYFVRIRDNPKANNYMQLLSLHRLGKRGNILITERWDRNKKNWVDNLSMLYRFSGMGGANDFREIVEPEATALIKQWSKPPTIKRPKDKRRWEDRRAKEFENAKEEQHKLAHHVTGPASVGPTSSYIQSSVVGALRRVVELQPLYINLPIDESQIELNKQQALGKLDPTVKLEPVDFDKLHITLIWSENCSDQAVIQSIKEVSWPMSFSVRVSRLEVLQSDDGLTLVWAVDPDPALVRLQTELYNAFKNNNIGLSEYSDQQVYKPHISIAYNLSHMPYELPSIEPFKISIDRVRVTRKDYRETMSIDLVGRDYPDPHCGLAGEHGGSRPRDECAPKDDEGKPISRIEATSDAQLDSAIESVMDTWHDYEGARIALSCLHEEIAEEGIGETHIWKRDDDLMGVMSISQDAAPFTIEQLSSLDAPGLEGDKLTQVLYIASKERGIGTRMMQYAVDIAADRGHGLWVYSEPEAMGFYEKIGMKSAVDSNTGAPTRFYYFTDEDVKSLSLPTVKKALPEVKPEDEPESGAFASPPPKIDSSKKAESKVAKKERRKKSKKKRKRKARK